MSQPPGTATIESLWRYPVKSMLGEELTESGIDTLGLIGDRAYALVDSATGKIASAKNPRKWLKLFDCSASYESAPAHPQSPPPAIIRLPGGEPVSTGLDTIHATLSAMLGREVTLKTTAPPNPSLEEYWPDIDGLAYRETITDEEIGLAAPAGTFFDSAPIHLLTTATLEQLHHFYPAGRFAVERFRPNLLLSSNSGEAGFVENGWIGRTIRIGEEVQLRVTNPCPRCVMTTLAQGDLPGDPGILRTVAQHNRVVSPSFGQALPSVGVYAVVERGGVVRKGDAVFV